MFDSSPAQKKQFNDKVIGLQKVNKKTILITGKT